MRTVAMDHSFYTGYRKNILAPDEVLVALILPYTKEDEHFVAYKQAREDSFRQVVSRHVGQS
jgi:xanthine dehydrogenase/oxidase